MIFKKNLHIIISFTVPIIILGLVYAAFGMYPFGNKTMLISDMEGQYIDFYSALYDILKKGQSLSYSWQAGMGHNFIGIYAYYLASPFSFLILLFNKQSLTEALFVMTLIKIGWAGLTCSIYLKYLSNKSRIYICIFSILYALMSYSIVYSFNIMWLDGVLLLPLVLLGVEKIIRANKFILFAISLFIAFIANFYISYMVGLFSFLYFIVCYFSSYPFKDWRIFIRKFLIFVSSAALAAGCAAFLLLPTFFALKYAQGMSKISLLNWKVNFPLLDLLYKLPMGSYDTLKSGLPNIYCGLLVLLICPFFFISSKIKIKEKILFSLFIIFMVFSFNFSNLNLMWHGFDDPNWFPYRYSFLFSFILINIAYRSINTLSRSQAGMVFKIYGVLITIIILLQKLGYGALSDKFIILNILFLSTYTFLLYALINHSKKRRAILIIMSLFIFAEVSLNTLVLIKRMDGEFVYALKDKYDSTLSNLDNVVRKVEANDTSFYRIDRTKEVERTLNDSMNLGYKGISHFSSTMNGKLNNFLGRLGFIIPFVLKVDYTGSTLVTDSLMGVKYIITEKTLDFGYKEILKNGYTKVYENMYAMPIGFLVNAKIKDIRTENKDPLQLQNDILNLSLGNEGTNYVNFFSPIEVSKVELKNIASSNMEGRQEFTIIDNKHEAFVEFTVESPRDEQMYVFMPPYSYSEVDAYINDNYVDSYLCYNNSTILDMGFHSKGDRIRFKLLLKTDSFNILTKYLYYFYGLNGEKFSSAITSFKQCSFQAAEVTDTMVRGRIEAKEDGVLFTSIPYDPGWEAAIDGKKAQIQKIGEAFMGLELAKGQHEIKFNFVPQGLRTGTLISTVSMVLFITLVYFFIKNNVK